MTRTRRDVLAAGAGLLAAGGMAGCLGTAGDGAEAGADRGVVDASGEGTAQTSFFVVDDLARAVGGDAIDVENVVPFGQHGHGWEPSTSVQQDIFTSNAFVYVGEGFQPWADEVIENIRHDDVDTRVIEARDGVDLLEVGDHDGEGADQDHDDDHDEHDDHNDDHDDDGETDPHYWLDPLRLKTTVENVRDGFAAIDPDNEDRFAANADDLLDRLDGLDRSFQDRLGDARTDTVVVAGHNAFRYLARRYDFEVHGLTGIAPDAEPSGRDIANARDVIQKHDVDHVLWPALESDRAARTLVEETDAEEALPITSVAGLSEEWRERGWGYLDVMENVNLESLETALQVP